MILDLLFAAALVCSPIDGVAAPHAEEAPHLHAALTTEGEGPRPRLLDKDAHERLHYLMDSREGAEESDYYCSPMGYEYREYVYYSSASHTTVVGWRIWDCQGNFHYNGATSAYCDKMHECCDTAEIDFPPGC
jgi:hypothetical protein